MIDHTGGGKHLFVFTLASRRPTFEGIGELVGIEATSAGCDSTGPKIYNNNSPLLRMISRNYIALDLRRVLARRLALMRAKAAEHKFHTYI